MHMRLQSECVYEMSHQTLYLYKFKWPSQADLTCHIKYYIIIIIKELTLQYIQLGLSLMVSMR